MQLTNKMNITDSRYIKIVAPSGENISLELGGDENELKDLVATLLDIPIFQIKGLKDGFGTYFTFSSLIQRGSTANLNEVYSLVCDSDDDKLAKKKNENENENENEKDMMENSCSKPKRLLNAFFLYLQYERPKLKFTHPDLDQPKVLKKLGERWKALSEADKAPYLKKAKNEQLRYQKEKEEFAQKRQKFAAKNNSSKLLN